MKKITLVLLPGLDGTGELFTSFLAALGSDYSTVIVRYINEKYFDDYVESVVSLLPVHGAVLIAESFSGPIALEVARRFPHKIDRIVLCATFASSPFRNLARLSGFIPEYFFNLKPLRRFLLQKLCLDSGSEDSGMEDILRVIQAIPACLVKSRLKVLAGIDMYACLSEISAQVLYLQAMQDKLVNVDLGDRLIRSLTNVTVQMIDGPHLLLQTRPEECAERIRKFI